MRHLVAGIVFAATVGLAAVAIDQVAARTRAEGHMWVLTRGPTGPAMVRVLDATRASVLQAWLGGRLLLLHLPSLEASAPPAGSAWLTLRMTPGAVRLAGCG